MPGPSFVNVTLVERDGALHLSVHDDGVGGAEPGNGSGLIGLRGRVEALGGTVEINQLSPGVHKFQCCIHPWMRAVVDVE